MACFYIDKNVTKSEREEILSLINTGLENKDSVWEISSRLEHFINDNKCAIKNNLSDLRTFLFAHNKNIQKEINNLQFYSASLTEDIENALIQASNKYEKKPKSGVISVSNYIRGQNLFENKLDNDVIKFIQTVQTGKGTEYLGLGEFTHKFFELREDSIAQQNLISGKILPEGFKHNMLTTIKYYYKIYNQLSQDTKSAIEGKYPGLIGFLRNLATNPNNQDRLIESLNNVSTSLNSKFNKHKIQNEVNIATEVVDGTTLTGRIDSILYNDDEVIILDFKTSARDLSSKSALEHFVQLDAYRNILHQYKIPKEKIQICNVLLTYNADGSIIPMSGTDSGIMDMDNAISTQDYKNAFQIINQKFPETVEVISSSEQKVLEEVIDKQTRKVCNSRMFYKKEPEFLEEYFTNCIENNAKAYSSKYDKLCNIKKNGEKYTLTYTLKNGDIKTIYEDLTIEEISKLEIEADQVSLQASSKRIRELLGKKNKQNILSYIKYRGDAQEALMINFNKYLSSSWTTEPNPILEKYGIITMVDINGIKDYIVITNHSKLNYSDAQHKPLLYQVTQKTFDGMPTYDIGSALALRSLLAVLNFQNTQSDDIKIGEVKVISMRTGISKQILNLDKYINSIKLLANESEDYKELNSIINRKVSIKSFKEIALNNIKNALDVINVESQKQFNLPNQFDKLNVTDKINALRGLIDQIKSEYPEDFSYNVLKNQVKTEPQITVNTIKETILILQDILSETPRETTKNGIAFQDIRGSFVDIFKYGFMQKYTSDGTLIGGIGAGLNTSSVYNSPSQIIAMESKYILGFTNQMKQQLVKECDEVNKATVVFFDYMKQANIISKLTDPFIGKHNKWYETLLKRTENGQIDNNLSFKNPFKDNTLLDYQKEYIEVLLWALNKRRIDRNSLDDKYRKMTWNEFKKTSAFQSYKQLINSNEQLLEIPLQEGRGFRHNANIMYDVTTGKYSVDQVWKKLTKKLKLFIDPKKLNSEQKKEQDKKINHLASYNKYVMSRKTRNNLVQENQISHWETNLNYLVNDFTYSYIQEDIMNKILPMVDDAIGALVLIQSKTGQDLSNQMDALMDRLRISIYNTNCIEGENQDLVSMASWAKHIISIMKLGGRPILAAKELLVGGLKNFSITAFDLFETSTGNKITHENITKALGYVIRDGFLSGATGNVFTKRNMGEFNFAEQLNNIYAITDRDSTIMSEAISVDNFGLFNTGERTLFYNTVRPDWYSRMTLFVAMMISDGTLDAHSVDSNGNLKYDMSKDRRFSEYYKHKNDPNYSTKTFQLQKALYQQELDELINLGITNKDGNQLKYGDDLPIAYTPAQISSAKEQIGSLYGMFDHEEKSSFQNGVWWNLFTQFLTYWPGDIHRYFMRQGQNSIGKYEQLYDDVTQKPLYWVDDNRIEKTTDPVDENGKDRTPVIGFKGSQAQGLLLSTMWVLGRAVKGDWTSLKADENVRKLHEMYAFLYNIGIGILLNTIIGLMIAMLVGDSKSEKELTTTARMVQDVLYKSSNELNFRQSVLSPIENFNIAGVSGLQDFGAGLIDAISNGNEAVTKTVYKNINALDDLHLMD